MNICIYGAGSIGCYVGGRLQTGGARVSFVGRERLAREVSTHGLHLSDFRGADLQVNPADIRFTTTPATAASAGLVLVTVKSAGTDEAGRELAKVLPPDALVISFQNGLGNAAVLRRHLTRQIVLTGMVPFNVVNRGQGKFHQGSEGALEAERHAGLDAWLPVFGKAGLPLMTRVNMREVLWAKLLLNLNNAINALSDVPLKTELSQRAYRQCLALAQSEGLNLLGRAGIRPAKLTPVPPHWIPALLGVPDFLFRLLANKMLAIDPLARSSMWDDLQAGRTTEIDWINGEVVKLAQELGHKAPVNTRLITLIREAEKGGRRQWPGEELLAALRGA